MDKEPIIRERLYCTKCKVKDVPLIKYAKNTNIDGVITQYHLCRPCNADRHKKWYDNGGQRKASRYNKRYYYTKDLK